MDNDTKYKIRVIILALSLVPIFTLSIYIHEVGHAITMFVSGGEILEMYVDIDSGYVKGFAPTNAHFLVGLMGGVFQAAFFLILTEYNKGFYIPSALALLYAIVEAFNYDLIFGAPIGSLIFYGIVYALVDSMGVAHHQCYGVYRR